MELGLETRVRFTVRIGVIFRVSVRAKVIDLDLGLRLQTKNSSLAVLFSVRTDER